MFEKQSTTLYQVRVNKGRSKQRY